MPYIGNQHNVGDHVNNFKVLDDIASHTATFDGSAASVIDTTNNTIRVPLHRFIQGQRVLYHHGGGGSNIGGLGNNTPYFIIFDTANTIKLATTLANANSNTVINLSAVGSGTSHTLNAAFDGVNTKFKMTHSSGKAARLNNATQINVAINNVIQRPNLDPNNFTDGFALEDNHKIVFKTAPTVNDIFWGSIIANTIENFDLRDNEVDNFTGNGSATEFTLSTIPANNESVMVTIDGVLQHPSDKNTTRAYTLINSIIQFTAAPALNAEIQVRHIGFAGASTNDVSGFYGRTGNVALTSSDHITTGDITSRNINSSGIITATTFSGGFSGNVVGTSATFTGNLSVGGVLTYEDVTNVDSVGIITAQKDIHVGAGVSAVGVGTFGSLDIGGDIDVDGHTNLDNVSIAGVTTISSSDLIVKPPTVSSSRIKLGYNEQMKISVSSANQNVIQSSAAYLQIANNNINLSRYDTNLHMARFLAGQQCKLTYNYIDRIATSGVGATVYGQFDTTNLTIAGVSTFTGNIDANANLDVAGIGTFADIHVKSNPSDTRITSIAPGALILSRNTPVIYLKDNLSDSFDASIELQSNELRFRGGGNNATGIRMETTSSGVSFPQDIDVDGHTNLDNVNIAGVTSVASLTSGRVVTVGTGGKLEDSSNLTFDGSILNINATVPSLKLTDSDGGTCYHEIKGPGNGDLRLSCDVGNTSSSGSEIQFLIHDDTKAVITSDGAVQIGNLQTGQNSTTHTSATKLHIDSTKSIKIARLAAGNITSAGWFTVAKVAASNGNYFKCYASIGGDFTADMCVMELTGSYNTSGALQNTYAEPVFKAHRTGLHSTDRITRARLVKDGSNILYLQIYIAGGVNNNTWGKSVLEYQIGAYSQNTADSGSAAMFAAGGSVTNIRTLEVDDNAICVSAGSHKFYSGGNATERLTIDSSGNLTAVNTTSGATTGVTLKVGASAASGTNSGTIIINNGGQGNASLQFDYENSAARAKIYTYKSTNDIIFDTSGAEKFRILNSGQLRGQGTYNGSSSTSNDFPCLNISNLQGSYTANNIISGITFGKVPGHTNGIRAGILALYSGTGSQNGNVGTDLVFRTANESAGDSNEKLRITSGGCVFANNFGIGVDNRWKIRPNNSYQDLAFEYSTSSTLSDTNIKVVMKPSGFVGINEQSPDNALHVTSTTDTQQIKVENTASSGRAQVRYVNPHADWQQGIIGGVTDGDFITYTSSSGKNIRSYTSNSERFRIKSNGQIIAGAVSNTGGDTNSAFHIESTGMNVESNYDFDDVSGSAPHLTLSGQSTRVRMDMGTMNNAPYGAWIQARYDNNPFGNSGTDRGREPIALNPRGGVVTFNLHDSNATNEIGGGGAGSQGGIVMRAGRANSTVVNNASTAIKIFPGEVRAYSGNGGTGEQNQGTKYGGIAWNILDPHNGSWGDNHDGHHCWMGMSLHSTPAQEKSNWQVQMNSNAGAGSYATNVAIQANPEGYVTHPNQPCICVGLNRYDTNIGGGNDLFQTYSSDMFYDVNQGNIAFTSSNGRFTIPINGNYMISFYSIKNGSGVQGYADIQINGSLGSNMRAYSQNNATSWSTYSCFGIKTLSKGDYINVKFPGTANNWNAHGAQHLRFVIALFS